MTVMTVIRCANGIVMWQRVPLRNDTLAWRCTRDKFQLTVPSDPALTEAFLVQVAQHSTQLAGAIQQVVQLDV